MVVCFPGSVGSRKRTLENGWARAAELQAALTAVQAAHDGVVATQRK